MIHLMCTCSRSSLWNLVVNPLQGQLTRVWVQQQKLDQRFGHVLTWNLDIATLLILMVSRKERCWNCFCKDALSFFHCQTQIPENWQTCSITGSLTCSSNHFAGHLDRNVDYLTVSEAANEWWSSWWQINRKHTQPPHIEKYWQHDVHFMSSAWAARGVAPKPACSFVQPTTETT